MVDVSDIPSDTAGLLTSCMVWFSGLFASAVTCSSSVSSMVLRRYGRMIGPTEVSLSGDGGLFLAARVLRCVRSVGVDVWCCFGLSC